MTTFAAIFVLIAAAVGAANSDDPTWLRPAADLVRDRSSLAPRDQHGALERSYSIRDVNFDEIPEVLEIVSHYDGKAAFLNSEIGPALDWVTVYQFVDGKYVEATSKYRHYLEGRKAFYSLWLRLLNSPAALSKDSQKLLQQYRPDFEAILEEYIQRVDRLLDVVAAFGLPGAAPAA